jgi:hypothetical protein
MHICAISSAEGGLKMQPSTINITWYFQPAVKSPEAMGLSFGKKM